ncbi:MAG TPA: exo-beta-N-acetylmuramidase NamZ domain-containing protein, partial [Bacteroidota bacterium]|nr:exo-beta-N-acetylmuramidase NamZ domain-containing protein [Bacteroidota bacterium]
MNWLFLILTLAWHSSDSPPPRVKTGADILIEQRLSLLRGKRVGLITNATGRIASGEMLLDALIGRGIAVTALFGPEHGIRGTSGAGEAVADSTDRETGIPIYSLYGRVRKPTPAMLERVDILVYDIQDVGARFYTYLSTMGLCMESAAERGIPFLVLDRPNPLGGDMIDGPVLPDSLR